MTTLQSISRPTSSSMAKLKDKKSLASLSNGRPGSVLRLRNMLTKRNPALKMMTEQGMIQSGTVY